MKIGIENVSGRILLWLPGKKPIFLGEVHGGIMFTTRYDWDEHHHRNMDAYGFCEQAQLEGVRLGFNMVDLKAKLEDGSILHVRMRCADMLANFKYTTTAKGYERQGYLDIATLKRINILNRPTIAPLPRQESLFA